MKKLAIYTILLIAGFLIQQVYVYYHEPKVVEVLPIQYKNQTVIIDPDYPEVARVVFSKKVDISEISFTVDPQVTLRKRLRDVFLRNEKQFDKKQKYTAIVLENTKNLEPNKKYTLRISRKGFNVIRFLKEKPWQCTIQTTAREPSLPTESGADLDTRLHE